MNRLKRPSLTASVLRALFARSGNQCAYPGCTHEIVDSENTLVGQVCHIEAAMPGGQRFNPEQTGEQRHGEENLILLCYRHHKETDDVEYFSVAALKKIKADHEKEFGRNLFKIDESALYKLSADMDQFWLKIDGVNEANFDVLDSPIEIYAKATILDLISQVEAELENVEKLFEWLKESDDNAFPDLMHLFDLLKIEPSVIEKIPYYKNPFREAKNFEVHCLGVPNTLNAFRLRIQQLSIKSIEEYLKTSPNDRVAKERLELLKNLFLSSATSAGRVD